MRARESARLRWRAATMESTRACLTALITANSAPIARSRSRCLRDGPPNGSGMGMLPAGVFIRTGSPFPRASAISNDWSRSFASRSSCVGPGGTSKPDVRPALSLSLTAFAAESARKGSELRLKPTTAPEIGAPAATREAAVVSRCFSHWPRLRARTRYRDAPPATAHARSSPWHPAALFARTHALPDEWEQPREPATAAAHTPRAPTRARHRARAWTATGVRRCMCT